jgi:hypothetical protein
VTAFGTRSGLVRLDGSPAFDDAHDGIARARPVTWSGRVEATRNAQAEVIDSELFEAELRGSESAQNREYATRLEELGAMVRRGRRLVSSYRSIERELIGRLGGATREEHDTSLRLLRILQTLSALDQTDHAEREAVRPEGTPKEPALHLDSQAVLNQTKVDLPSRPASLAAAAYAKNQHAYDFDLSTRSSPTPRRNDER